MTDRLYTQRQIRDALVLEGARHEPDSGKPPGSADILAALALAETPVFDKPGYSNYDRVGDLDRVGQAAGGGKHYGPSVTSFQIRTLQEDTGKRTKRDIDYILQSLNFGCWAAIEIANGSGYEAWTTYTSNKYKAYLQEFYPPPDGVYVVVSGDTMYLIDRKLGLPRGTMLKWNPNRRIPMRPGDHLQLGYVERTVKSGDTLYYLMKTAGYTNPSKVDISEVATYALLDPPYTIYPKQVLRILKPGWEG